ncbi:fluoride efflux transporter CrcB [Streptomyces sp. NBC_01476]|uniref:fluoride efflux transporter CrcB n=1 Tax=Streptomyces sp. NBC_01476 TaxID=2903881 RepID=UPI002E328874|nr:fluoride efflux transporter CrcB [Streptomyces sp. NBC_01476]
MASDSLPHHKKEPMNCDFDALAANEHRWRARGADVIAVVAAGGVIGAEARYLASRLWSDPAGRFPYTTFGVNLTGCFLIGVLLVVVSDMRTVNRLVRPFLATGVLGGFTTFSTYAVDSQRLIATGHPGPALVNILGTMAGALAAVSTGALTTRRIVALRSARRAR